MALAFPPLRPPFLPIWAKYSESGERDDNRSCSSVDSRTISAALWFTSMGSLLERLMYRSVTECALGV
jgi:hypothetical protein